MEKNIIYQLPCIDLQNFCMDELNVAAKLCSPNLEYKGIEDFKIAESTFNLSTGSKKQTFAGCRVLKRFKAASLTVESSLELNGSVCEQRNKNIGPCKGCSSCSSRQTDASLNSSQKKKMSPSNLKDLLGFSGSDKKMLDFLHKTISIMDKKPMKISSPSPQDNKPMTILKEIHAALKDKCHEKLRPSDIMEVTENGFEYLEIDTANKDLYIEGNNSQFVNGLKSLTRMDEKAAVGHSSSLPQDLDGVLKTAAKRKRVQDESFCNKHHSSEAMVAFASQRKSLKYNRSFKHPKITSRESSKKAKESKKAKKISVVKACNSIHEIKSKTIGYKRGSQIFKYTCKLCRKKFKIYKHYRSHVATLCVKKRASSQPKMQKRKSCTGHEKPNCLKPLQSSLLLNELQMNAKEENHPVTDAQTEHEKTSGLLELAVPTSPSGLHKLNINKMHRIDSHCLVIWNILKSNYSQSVICRWCDENFDVAKVVLPGSSSLWKCPRCKVTHHMNCM